MNINEFAAAADFPNVWLSRGLLDGSFFQEQAAEFEVEYGRKKPQGGTEHWRYGSFNYWLRSDLDRERTLDLFEAALADPDPPMAGNVIKALLASPFATEQMLSDAVSAVEANRYYYVGVQELKRIFCSADRRG